MKTKQSKRPDFLWDYNLTEKEVRRLLKEGNGHTKEWLVARILESATFKEVWKYLTLKEVLQIFPKLHLREPVKEAWKEAFKAWRVGYEKNDSHSTATNLS